MANPNDNRAIRLSAAITFSNVTSSETARQAVTFQGGGAINESWVLDGFLLMRTGGTGGAIVSTLRVWDASSSGVNVYQNNKTLSANNDSAGSTGLGMPLNTAAFSQLNVSLQNDAGTDQDYTLYLILKDRVNL